MGDSGGDNDPSGGEPGCVAVAYGAAAALLALAALLWVWVEYVEWSNAWKVFAGAAATVGLLALRDWVMRLLGLPGGDNESD